MRAMGVPPPFGIVRRRLGSEVRWPDKRPQELSSRVTNDSDESRRVREENVKCHKVQIDVLATVAHPPVLFSFCHEEVEIRIPVQIGPQSHQYRFPFLLLTPVGVAAGSVESPQLLPYRKCSGQPYGDARSGSSFTQFLFLVPMNRRETSSATRQTARSTGASAVPRTL